MPNDINSLLLFLSLNIFFSHTETTSERLLAFLSSHLLFYVLLYFLLDLYFNHSFYTPQEYSSFQVHPFNNSSILLISITTIFSVLFFLCRIFFRFIRPFWNNNPSVYLYLYIHANSSASSYNLHHTARQFTSFILSI